MGDYLFYEGLGMDLVRRPHHCSMHSPTLMLRKLEIRLQHCSEMESRIELAIGREMARKHAERSSRSANIALRRGAVSILSTSSLSILTCATPYQE